MRHLICAMSFTFSFVKSFLLSLIVMIPISMILYNHFRIELFNIGLVGCFAFGVIDAWRGRLRS